MSIIRSSCSQHHHTGPSMWGVWSVTLLLLICLAACGETAHSQSSEFTSPRPATSVSTPATPASTTTPVDEPRRLLIPAIKLDAQIEHVGITKNGDMDTPQQDPWNHVGWYSAGTAPGNRGSAVIAGHLDRPGGAGAVFWSLNKLRAGNEVSVVLASGKTVRFRVVRLVFYAPDKAPLQDIFADTSGSYLNLITCAGNWVPAQHQTSQRLVVYTSLL